MGNGIWSEELCLCSSLKIIGKPLYLGSRGGNCAWREDVLGEDCAPEFGLSPFSSIKDTRRRGYVSWSQVP